MQLSLFKFLDPFRPKKPPVKKRKTRKRRPTSGKSPRKRRSPGVSDLNLLTIWLALRREWFPERPDIDKYVIVWSTRPQKRTLASCNVHRKRVNVARELNYPQHLEWLVPLLYHEMCHAVLGLTVERWHGKEFKALERRHPQIKEMDKWIKDGGWATAVRSDRSKRAHQARKKAAS